MTDLAIYFSLFATAFIAATVLPVQSEAVFVGLILSENHPLAYLLAAASVGNVLGSTVNWLLGRGIERFRDRPWFPASPSTLVRTQTWYQRYGKWSLLLSWAPLIGDPLTVVAGVLREPFPTFLLLVTIAKVARYLAVAAITLQWA
jgi:membrane protein YqaA with SNARE-associated domain